MSFRDGRCWSGSAASKAANRERRKGRLLFSGISFRRRGELLMISRVRGRINGGIGGCWDWVSGAGNDSEMVEPFPAPLIQHQHPPIPPDPRNQNPNSTRLNSSHQILPY